MSPAWRWPERPARGKSPERDQGQFYGRSWAASADFALLVEGQLPPKKQVFSNDGGASTKGCLHEISQQRQHQLDESGQSDLQREKLSPEPLLHVTARRQHPRI